MIEIMFGDTLNIKNKYKLEVVGYNPITQTTALLDLHIFILGCKRKASRIGRFKYKRDNWSYFEFKYLGQKFLLKIFI